MNRSRLASVTAAATIVLLTGCEGGATTAAAVSAHPGGVSTTLAVADPRGGTRTAHGIEGEIEGFGIRPTGATANGIMP